MNAGACPNEKCNEFIDFESIEAYPTNCKRCSERITETHHQHFKEILNMTQMHLDKMKLSSVACKFWYQIFHLPLEDHVNSTEQFTPKQIHFEKFLITLVTDLDICSILVSKQRGILHKLNVFYLKTLDLAFESAIDVEKWDEALVYGNELIPGFRLVQTK